MALSTKTIPTRSGISKSMKPGNLYAKILNIYLKEDTYARDKGNDGAYFVILQLEGPDLGESFEGFLIDKDNPELGRHKGQVATVKANAGFSYYDKVVGKNEFNRDTDILTLLSNIAVATGKKEQIDEISANNIEEYVQKASDLLSGDDSWMHYCIGGQEYSRNGYPTYALHLVKADYRNNKFAFAANEESVVKFNQEKHIVVKKKKTTAVDEFEPGDTVDINTSAEMELAIEPDLPF